MIHYRGVGKFNDLHVIFMMFKKLNLTILIIFQQANNYYFKIFYYLRLSLVTLLALPFDFYVWKLIS